MKTVSQMTQSPLISNERGEEPASLEDCKRHCAYGRTLCVEKNEEASIEIEKLFLVKIHK